jgi:hypothetical protein
MVHLQNRPLQLLQIKTNDIEETTPTVYQVGKKI